MEINKPDTKLASFSYNVEYHPRKTNSNKLFLKQDTNLRVVGAVLTIVHEINSHFTHVLHVFWVVNHDIYRHPFLRFLHNTRSSCIHCDI